MDSEGSRRLIQAAAEAGADAVRGVELEPEEIERRRQTALELNLKQHLYPGYHGPRWTPQELALLGTLPDEEVAARTGKTPGAVRQARNTGRLPGTYERMTRSWITPRQVVDYFAIVPDQLGVDRAAYAPRHGGTACPDGFRHSSEANSQWLSVWDLRAMIGMLEAPPRAEQAA
jgi:hypothetical protein